jgi:hypothetical protein
MNEKKIVPVIHYNYKQKKLVIGTVEASQRIKEILHKYVFFPKKDQKICDMILKELWDENFYHEKRKFFFWKKYIPAQWSICRESDSAVEFNTEDFGVKLC